MKISNYPGTPLKEADIKEKQVLTAFWRPKAKYAWSAGVAITRFLEELKNGRLLGRKCSKCGRVLVPPRMYCELCFRPTDEWIYVRDTGRIATYSISYLSADAKRLKEPIIVAVIDLDDTPPNVGILHRIGEVSKEELPAWMRGEKFGVRVKAVWKPPEERVGSINDIKYWKPIEV